MRRQLQKFCAVFFVSAILGGGPGAPVLDALLYHWGPVDLSVSRSQLHAQGERTGHADACSLGCVRTQPTPVTTASPAIVLVALVTATTVVRTAVPPTPHRFSPQQPRAPPAPSA
jgi:hypothetical protein